MIILYITTNAPQKTFDGVNNVYSMSDMHMPRCYVLGSNTDKGGFGTKIEIDNCKTIGYWPNNNYTTQIMSLVTSSLNLPDGSVQGYMDYQTFKQSTNFNLFGINFNSPYWNSSSMDIVMENLSVLIMYNQTYIDQPHFYALYQDEVMAQQLVDSLTKWISFSSFPLILSAHISSSLLQLYNITYIPSFSANPQQPTTSAYAPNYFLTAILFTLVFALQFIFALMHMNEDKLGPLDALRLAGVTDIIYVSENFVFQFIIYIITASAQLFTLYGLPGGNDEFIFTPISEVILILIIGGFYSTCLAVFWNSLVKKSTQVVVLMFALFIAFHLVEYMFDPQLLYDVSVFSSFILFLIRWLYPFATILGASINTLSYTQPSISFDRKSISQILSLKNPYDFSNFTSISYNISGCYNTDVVFNFPSSMWLLFLCLCQGFIFLFLGWVLGEWLPYNSSACRPIWKIFNPNIYSAQSLQFTYAQAQEFKKDRFRKRVKKETTQNCRKNLSKDDALKCMSEVSQKIDKENQNQTVNILTHKPEDNDVLITHHLHKKFLRNVQQQKLLGKYQHAVESVSLVVHQGEIFGLAGHNGAGKTTTLNMVIGAIPLDDPGFRNIQNDNNSQKLINNAWIDNVFSVRQDISQIRRIIGCCPQFNTNVYSELTIKQNLQLMCKLQNIPKYDHDRLISSILISMNLLAWKDKKISQLSGGMQRRICISMAIIGVKTRLIILDEPSTGLDPVTKRIIWTNIKKVAQSQKKSPIMLWEGEGITVKRTREKQPGIILTSHDMNELNTICDTIQIMSAGQIVAQGTALSLKCKYGSGFTLTIQAKSSDDNKEFVKQFEEFQNKYDINEPKQCKLIDQSSATSVYSISNDATLYLQRILHYLENSIRTNSLISDFNLERTSMDEVFITVGKMYAFANGADTDDDWQPHQKHIQTEQQDDNLDTVNIENKNKEKSVSFDNEIEFGSDDSIDIRYNTAHAQSSQIKNADEVLSPQREKPATFRVLMCKMIFNDKMHRLGILSYVILPIVLLVFIYLTEDQLLPWLISVMNNIINTFLGQWQSVCSICTSLKILNQTIPDCYGFDAWGFQNFCQVPQVAQHKQFQPQATWYGGDINVWPYSPNLYNNQLSNMNVYVFDQNQIFGKSISSSPLISLQQSGLQQIQQQQLSMQGTNITLTGNNFIYQTANGTPYNSYMAKQLQLQTSNFEQTQQSILQMLPVKPIAVQRVLQNNDQINEFDIYQDVYFQNGYQTYNTQQELNFKYLSYQLKQTLGFTGFPNPRPYSCSDAFDSNGLYYFGNNYQGSGWGINDQLIINKSGLSEQQIDRIFAQQGYYACIGMDDTYAVTYLQQQTAQKLPLGLINLDNQSSLRDRVFKPLIQSFAPARTISSFYYNYNINALWVTSDSLNQMMSMIPSNVTDNLTQVLATSNTFSLIPTYRPTIMQQYFLENYYTSPQTPIIDIQTRLANAILKNQTNKPLNFRIGTQMFPYKQFDVLNVGAMAAETALGSLLSVIVSFAAIQKLGQHIVLDRQTEFRRQLFLNGVNDTQYWITFISYSVIISILVQIIVWIVTAILNIHILQKIDSVVFFVLSLGAICGTTSLSIFASSFIKQIPAYNIVAIIFIVFSTISTILHGNNIVQTAPWYSYLLPSTAYAQIMLSSSQFCYTLPELLSSGFGTLTIMMFVISIAYTLIGIYIDKILPINGYKPQSPLFILNFKEMFRKPLKQSQNEFRNLLLKSSISLNKVDKSKLEIETVRDQAALHNEDRMDNDVKSERQNIQNIDLSTPVIVCNVEKIYNKFLALRDLSFHIKKEQKGSVFALLGPNGAAKTTTLNIIIGLLKQSQGQVFLHGNDMSDPKQAVQAYRNIGLCSQCDVFLPNLTVRMHLKLFAIIHGVPWKKSDEIVQKLANFVQLGEVLDKYVNQLSGGMKRRMSLALALIG